MRTFPRWILAAAFCLMLAASARAQESESRVLYFNNEEAAPPAYPREDSFRLGRYGTESDRKREFKLSDGDVIRVERRPMNPRSERTHEAPSPWVEIVLDTPHEVTWWKGITIYKNELPSAEHPRGRWLKLAQLNLAGRFDNTPIYQLPASQLRGGIVLVFEKAKALGVHTPMHGLLLDETNDDLTGQIITFVWEKDS
ncbi:MAG: hypothetical protein ACJ741_19875 [Pyrinomonadaceae bacterium]